MTRGDNFNERALKTTYTLPLPSENVSRVSIFCSAVGQGCPNSLLMTDHPCCRRILSSVSETCPSGYEISLNAWSISWIWEQGASLRTDCRLGISRNDSKLQIIDWNNTRDLQFLANSLFGDISFPIRNRRRNSPPLFGTLLSQINKSVSVKVIKSNRVLDLYVERNFRDIHDVDTCIFANYWKKKLKIMYFIASSGV